LVYWCAFSYEISILAYGLLDWVTWGYPFQSVIVNVQVNLSGFAEAHGTMPFWGYLRLWWDHGDRPLLVAVMIGATLASVRNFKKLSSPCAIVLGATLGYFLFCSAIKHKELRFILPSLPAFYILGVSGFETIFERIRVPVPLAISLLLTASITTWIFEYHPSRFHALDLTRVSNAVLQDSRKSGRSISCVGFIGHHPIWSRGKMIYGQDVELKQVDEKAQSTDCNYLIVGGWIDRNQEIFKKFEAFYSDNKKNQAMVRVALESAEFIPMKSLAARAQSYPEVVQGTAQFHQRITDARFPQAEPILHDATALDTTMDMLAPQPTLVEDLVRPLLRSPDPATTDY